MSARPKDSREFVRISTSLPDDPKLAEIDSPQAGLAGWLYVTAICWADSQKTDGLITPRTVERKAGVSARWSRELVRVGLWHAPGHSCPVCPQPGLGKLVIHDYLDHQRSKAEAAAAKESGRLAAEARWGAKGNAKRIAKRTAPGSAQPNAEGNTEVEVEGEEEQTTDYVGGLDRGSDPSSSRPGKRDPKPADDDGWRTLTNPDDIPAGVDANAEWTAFTRYNAVSTLKNPRAAWLGWLKKARTRNTPTPTPSTSACPIHPDQLTGSKACPQCAAEAAPAGPPPADLRAHLTTRRRAS